MEIQYQKAALQTYMEQVEAIGKNAHHVYEDSLDLYHSCEERYSRLFTRLEEAAQSAHAQLENAESKQRLALLEYETASRISQTADDESSQNAAAQRMGQAQQMRAAAQRDFALASAAYEKAIGDLGRLSALWENYARRLQTQVRQIEGNLGFFSQLIVSGNRDLRAYMDLMQKAQTALYDGTVAVDSPASVAGGLPTGAPPGSMAGTLPTGAPAENMTGTLPKGAPPGNMAGSLPKGTPPGNMAGTPGAPGQGSSGPWFSSKQGNTLGATVASNGEQTYQMTLQGTKMSFPGTKSGIAKAYRVALQYGDKELAAYAGKLFEQAGLSGSRSPKKAAGPENRTPAKTFQSTPVTDMDSSQIAAALVEQGLVRRANFGKLDKRTAQDMYQSISRTLEQFPEIDLRFVGSLQARNQSMQKSLEKLYLDAYRKHYPTASDRELMPFVQEHVSRDMKDLEPHSLTIAQSFFMEPSPSPRDTLAATFNGISINEQYGTDYQAFVRTKKHEVTMHWKPLGCDTPGATVDHELGHQIAQITKAHDDAFLRDMYSRFRKLNTTQRGETLSGYAAESIHEFLAEGWAEFCNNPACRPLAKAIGNRLLALYRSRSQS